MTRRLRRLTLAVMLLTAHPALAQTPAPATLESLAATPRGAQAAALLSAFNQGSDTLIEFLRAHSPTKVDEQDVANLRAVATRAGPVEFLRSAVPDARTLILRVRAKASGNEFGVTLIFNDKDQIFQIGFSY